MTLFRKVYQHPIFDFGLIVALMAHYTSSTIMYIRRSKTATSGSSKKDDDDPNTKPSNSDHSLSQHHGAMELKTHRYTGYFLSFAVLTHVIVTRMLPMLSLPDPKLYDYTFSTYAQQKLYGPVFGIYNALFGMAGGWHLIYGTRSAIHTLFYDKSVAGTAFPIWRCTS